MNHDSYASGIPAAFLEVLQCPKHAEALHFDGTQLVSNDAKECYPIINSTPWLLQNPLHSMVDWSIKLNHFSRVLGQEIQQLERELKNSQGATRERLELLLGAKQRFVQDISTLVSPILSAKVASKPVYDALSDRAPSTQNLLSYEANLYRDWVWGDEENEQYAELVTKALSAQQHNRVAILGAGSARLSYDLARALDPELLVSNDINPLLVFAAKEILFGQGLAIDEFPFHPKNIASTAIRHQIEAIKDCPGNLHFLFSDAAKPALRAASMDVVVTPWLIDIQPLPLLKFLKAINHYLPTGGLWVNFGSLVFQQQRESLCYSIEEIASIAEQAGFKIEEISEQALPYLKSPYNAGYRIETVWSWRAVKVKDVTLSESVDNLPDWIIDATQAVPNDSKIQSLIQTNQVYIDLAKKVNGKRSLVDISKHFARDYNVSPQESLQLVKEFFQKIAFS